MSWILCFFMMALFFATKQCMWGESCYMHEAGYLYNWRLLQDDWKHAFKIPFLLFPTCVYGLMYSRSNKIGNRIYDLMLTVNGLLCFLFVLQVTGAPAWACCSLMLFYLTYTLPQVSFGFVQPEHLGSFFVLAAINVTFPGVNEQNGLLLYSSGILAGLSFLVKASHLTHVWPVLLACSQQPDVITLTPIVLGMATIYIVPVLLIGYAEYVLNDSIIKNFINWLKQDKASRVASSKKFQWIKPFAEKVLAFSSLVFPYATLAVLYFYNTLSDQYVIINYVMLLFMLTAFLCTLVRCFFVPVYCSLMFFPLAFFGGGFLYFQIDQLKNNFILTLVLISLILIQQYFSRIFFRTSIISTLYNVQRDVTLYKRLVLDKIKDIITENTSIFHNTHLTSCYTEQKCIFPKHQFLWLGDRLPNVLMDNTAKQELARFFIESTPDLLILHPNSISSPFDLNLFEQQYGVTYELLFEAHYFMVYQKKDQTYVEHEMSFEITNLLTKNSSNRYQQDKIMLLQKVNTLIQGATAASQKKSPKSSKLLKIAWFLSSNPYVGLLLAKDQLASGVRTPDLEQHLDTLALLAPDDAFLNNIKSFMPSPGFAQRLVQSILNFLKDKQ